MTIPEWNPKIHTPSQNAHWYSAMWANSRSSMPKIGRNTFADNSSDNFAPSCGWDCGCDCCNNPSIDTPYILPNSGQKNNGYNFNELNQEPGDEPFTYAPINRETHMNSLKDGLIQSKTALEKMDPNARENGGVPDDEIAQKTNPNMSHAMDFLDLGKVTPQENLAWWMLADEEGSPCNKATGQIDYEKEEQLKEEANENPEAVRGALKNIYYGKNLDQVKLPSEY